MEFINILIENKSWIFVIIVLNLALYFFYRIFILKDYPKRYETEEEMEEFFAKIKKNIENNNKKNNI